jgi:hypothetical protein
MKTPDLTFLLSKDASRALTVYQIARRDDSSLFAIEKARQQLSDDDYSDFCFCVELLERARLTQPKSSPAGEWVDE